MKNKQISSQQPLIKKIRRCLGQAEGEKVGELKVELREAQMGPDELRDLIISQVRREDCHPSTRSRLERVNSILSLLMGTKYP